MKNKTTAIDDRGEKPKIKPRRSLAQVRRIAAVAKLSRSDSKATRDPDL